MIWEPRPDAPCEGGEELVVDGHVYAVIVRHRGLSVVSFVPAGQLIADGLRMFAVPSEEDVSTRSILETLVLMGRVAPLKRRTH